jgi:hypothetical protein
MTAWQHYIGHIFVFLSAFPPIAKNIFVAPRTFAFYWDWEQKTFIIKVALLSWSVHMMHTNAVLRSALYNMSSSILKAVSVRKQKWVFRESRANTKQMKSRRGNTVVEYNTNCALCHCVCMCGCVTGPIASGSATTMYQSALGLLLVWLMHVPHPGAGNLITQTNAAYWLLAKHQIGRPFRSTWCYLLA